MTMKNVLTIWTALSFLQCYGCAQPQRNGMLIEELLGADYESVVVSDGALLSGSARFAQLPTGIVTELQMPFAQFLAAMSKTGSAKKQQVLRHVEIVAVGAKNFRPPNGLGPVVSERCYVAKLAPGRQIEFQGKDVAGTSTTPIRSWAFDSGISAEIYVAQPGSDYIILGTSVTAVEGVLARFIKGASADSTAPALLSGIRDAKEVRQKAVWGWRAYSQNTSALSRQASGALEIGRLGRAILFFLEPSRNSLVFRYLSTTASEEVNTILSHSTRLPTFSKVGDSIWETVVPLNSTGQEQIFTVISLFGFGMYL